MRSGELKFLQIEGWKKKEEITHGFGTRNQEGEKPIRMSWMRQAVLEGKEAFPLISLHQVHGDRVVLFDGNRQKIEGIWRQEGDALITRARGFALGVFTADCLPIFLYDPVQEAIGVVHTGWRGTAKRVSQKALEAMEETFGCRKRNILAAMGPCIGPCCYEIDEPVRIAFSAGGLPWDLISQARGREKWLLDLYQANLFILEMAGVRKENIQFLKICTSCHQDIFYSYRNADTRGRHLNFIALRKGEAVFQGPKENGGGT